MEKNLINCENHDVELNGFSCYMISNSDKDKKGWTPFPDKSENQIIFLNLKNKLMKE